MSQRRLALHFGVSRRTVVRKLRFQAEQARQKQAAWLKSQEAKPFTLIQFDELETSEHTKLKPLSVALAVEAKSRKILGFQVSSMPAKGVLASMALKKYGPRKDLRREGLDRLFLSLKLVTTEQTEWVSDQNPHYPKALRKHHAQATHTRHKGRRGCVVGQGELKKIGFDPLFSLNHTCAMLRANLNRLFRRTWCTTKNQQGLIDHLSLYVHFHNQELTPLGAA